MLSPSDYQDTDSLVIISVDTALPQLLQVCYLAWITVLDELRTMVGGERYRGRTANKIRMRSAETEQWSKWNREMVMDVIEGILGEMRNRA